MKNEKRCIIITAYQEISLRKNVSIGSDDYIICADGGVDFALSENIKPDIILGDFDSSSQKTIEELSSLENAKVFQVEKEKDDTDTLLCVKKSLEMGFKNLILLGGLGGRFDHTFANLQCLSYFLDQTFDIAEKSIWIMDGKNQVTMIENSSLTFHKRNFSDIKNMKISLFSYTESSTGVTVSGVKYPLKDAVLTNSFPIGVSNEFAEDSVHIENKGGKLLVVLSRD